MGPYLEASDDEGVDSVGRHNLRLGHDQVKLQEVVDSRALTCVLPLQGIVRRISMVVPVRVA